MARIKLGTTLSGSLWLEHITDLFSLDGRFARGKTYFNKGYVKKFSFDGSFVEAGVKGSYGNYQTHFEFDNDEDAKRKIIDYFQSNPMAQSSLLNGELTESFFDWCKSENITLFITKKHIIQGIRHRSVLNYEASCSCYDFYDAGSPCKHLNALLFALCAEIDTPIIPYQIRQQVRLLYN